MTPAAAPLFGARRLRLCDLTPYEAVVAQCSCGKTAEYGPGEPQRLYRVPSDTLIHDLQARLRCPVCGHGGTCDIGILDTRKRRRKRQPPAVRLVARRPHGDATRPGPEGRDGSATSSP